MKITKKKSVFEQWLQYLGLPLALCCFAFFYTMDTPEGLTVQGQISLAAFAMAFILWVSEALPTYTTALLSLVVLTLTGAWTEKNVLGVFGYDVIWLMLAAFIITSGMEKSGVARRLALWMVTRFGKTASATLLVLMITNFVIAFVVPSTTARAALMLPICLLVAQTYGAKPGESNFGRALMIQEVHANNISTTGILTATAPQILAIGLIKDLTGHDVTWMDWFLASMPIAICTMIFSFVVGLILFPSETKTPQGKGVEELKKQLIDMGPMSSIEWRAIIIFALTVFLWATSPWHIAMFGVNISLVMVAILAGTVLFLPGIGFLTWKETKIPWDLMLFSCGAYAVGLAFEKSGAASWAMNWVFSGVAIDTMPAWMAFGIVMAVATFSHMVFSSKVVRTVILIPTVVGLANSAGISPFALALPAAFTIADSITLPPNCKPNLIFYSTGYFTVLNQLSYGVIVLIGKVALLTIASVTWFKFLGIN
ncbi:MAG: DASS family sodium-coupled anion symporter [Mailhella sp.]|nr:DASS family sodium-coupled anion symporter [Mailhella sp.]